MHPYATAVNTVSVLSSTIATGFQLRIDGIRRVKSWVVPLPDSLQGPKIHIKEVRSRYKRVMALPGIVRVSCHYWKPRGFPSPNSPRPAHAANVTKVLVTPFGFPAFVSDSGIRAWPLGRIALPRPLNQTLTNVTPEPFSSGGCQLMRTPELSLGSDSTLDIQT